MRLILSSPPYYLLLVTIIDGFHCAMLCYDVYLDPGTMFDVTVACFKTLHMLISPTSGLGVGSFPRPMTSPSLAMPS